MKLKRFVAIVISLAMVLSIAPSFSLTASAESLAADAELVFDGKFGVGASTYSVEFTMGGSSFGYKDTGMVDTAGNYIGGFCYAGPTDGFYPADGERSVSLSSGFSQTSDTGGSTKWTSGSSRMNITFNILTSSTYEIVYTLDGTYVATVTYSGSPQGITHPLAWKGTGWGGASPAYDNVVITVDGETVYDESNLPDLATASDWYAMEFTLSTGRDGATSGYRDWQIKDADGNQFTGFCFAGTSDGFYPGDRQSLSSGFSLTETNSDTSTTWTSMSTKMRVAVTKGDGTYTVTYTKIVDGTETELSKFTYSGTPNGISLPYEWATTGGSGSFTFANVQVYAVVPEATKDITATYTVNGTTVKTQTKTIDTSVADSASFDAVYYRANGTNTLYCAAAQTLSESATIEMTLLDNWGNYSVGNAITVDSTPYVVKSGNIVPNGNFEYGMNGWYNRAGSTPPESYSITTTDKPDVSTRAALSTGAGGASSTNSIKQGWDITVGTTYYYSLWVKAGDEWHGLGQSDSPSTEALDLVGNGGFGKAGTWVQKTGVFTATNEYLVFFEGWGSVGLADVEVYEVEVDANQLKTYTVVATGSVSDSYTTTAISVDKLEIPYYEGNILKSRSVDGTTVTFTYEATETSLGSWAIRNNVTSNTWISEMKYLGTHNSFANVDSVVVNEGGVLRNSADNAILESNKTVPYADGTSSTVVSASKAQTLDALDQLNAGVRYFDIRLTRQSDGTFWSFHGPAFADFRPIAATIAQWAKENPGEVIILDFQYAWDALYKTIVADTTYNGDTVGDDNADFYAALEALLTETGVMDYVPSNFDQRYGAMTSEGTQTAILTISKARGANCIDKFQSRDLWTSGDTTYNSSSIYSTVVSTIESAISAGAFGSGAKFGIIHAYTTPLTGLISAADTNRSKWINEDLDTWMKAGYGDVLLMNNVTKDDITTYLARLSEYNRDYLDDQLGSEFHGETALTAGGLTMTGATSSVPFSSEFTVAATNDERTITIDGVEYTTKTVYQTDLMQFDTNSVDLTGNVTLTFPQVSDGSTTVDVLLFNNEVVATAGVGEAISYTTSSLGYFILATKAAPGVNLTVQYVADGTVVYSETSYFAYGLTAYDVPAGDFYIKYNGKAYIVNSASEQTYTVSTNDTDNATLTVSLTMVSENAVLADTFGNNDGSNDCNNTDNMLFVGSSGISDPGNNDAAGDAVMANNGGNVGSPRIPVLMFNVPEVAEGKAVKLHLYVAKANQNLNEGGSMKLAANVADVAVDETQGYVASSIANTTGVVWSDTMFTTTGAAVDGRMPVDAWVEIDVTEFVAAATGDTITFTLYAPTAGAYVADREKTVAGGAYQGKAAYLEVVDANTVTVSGAALVTKSGKDVTTDAADGILVPVDSTIKVRETGADLVAVTDGANVYATNADGWVTLTPSKAAGYYVASLGVAMVDGAQVRIGSGVDSEGKVGSGSGLRFITTVNMTDTLVSLDNATFGVEITAEGNEDAKVVISSADEGFTYQDDDNATFTAALTNLAVGNYNRKFTATPYVTVDGQTFYGTPVTRSIYQVAAGLLTKDDADGTEYSDTALESKALYNVLNAYVNQTGIRLTLAENSLVARTGDASGAYSSDAFFTVGETTVEDGKYTVVLTPVGEKTEIKLNTIKSEKSEDGVAFYKEYVRINNNNTVVYTAVDVVYNKDDNTYTLTFDTTQLNQ